MHVVDITNASVRIDHSELLHAINLTVEEREIIAIVGPNGAGKSTLIRAIAGDIALTTGEIRIGEKAADKWEIRARARHVAVLPQFSLLNFPYTVNEVVALGRIPHSSGLCVDREIVREAMFAMDIDYLNNRLYTELSGGEKQRTQLARVMTQIWRAEDASSRLLLLDEPTTALDLGHQVELMEKIRNFANTGAAVLMVLHDLNTASVYSDRILALACGRAIAQGKSRELITPDLVKKLFGSKVKTLRDPDTQRLFVLP